MWYFVIGITTIVYCTMAIDNLVDVGYNLFLLKVFEMAKTFVAYSYLIILLRDGFRVMTNNGCGVCFITVVIYKHTHT